MRSCATRSGFGVWLVVVLLLGSGPVWGQTGTSSIYGEVKDQQGAAVPGATVTITSVGTKATRNTVTSETGVYQFVAVPPGMYDLRVELSGFKTALREKIDLLVDSSIKLNLPLEIGSLAETVEVIGVTSVINTTDASLGNVLSGAHIQRLPLEARNPVGLLSLQPGAVYLPTDDQRSGAVSGARSDQANVTLDGVDVNDQQNQTAFTTVLRVTLESLQEFRVTTSNYGAEQGRSSAAQVSLVTKSGTNDFRGATYWAHRNTATSSNEYFLKLAQLRLGQESEPPKLNKHVFGTAVGGPIKRDRLFFFGNFEGLKDSRETSVERSVPSASFRDGVLIYRCQRAAECPGGTVAGLRGVHTVPAGHFGLTPAQAAAIDPLGLGPNLAAAEHFRRYPTPNAPGRDSFNIMGFRFAAPVENEFRTYIARLDYKIDATGNHRLFGRLNLQDDVLSRTPQFPGQPPNSVLQVNNMGTAIGYDAVLSPNLVNTFRYGYTEIDEATVGLRRSNAVTFRFITDFEALTPTNARRVPTHNWVNDLAWIKGDHTWKFGTNIRRSRIPRFTNEFSFHTATANASWTAGVGRRFTPGRATCSTPGCSAVPAVDPSFAAVYADSFIPLLGIISQASARYNYNKDGSVIPVGEPVQRTYGADEYEFYAQDSWRLISNLTVTAGLRYSLFSPPFETDGFQVAPTISLGQWFEQRRRNGAEGIPSNAIPPFTIDLAGPANNRKGFYEWDYNNFAPRVAAAWTPRFSKGLLGWLTGKDRMVIRGGYSLVYDRIGQGLATQFDNFGSFGLLTSITSPFGSANESTPGIRFVNLNTIPPHLPRAPRGGFPQTPPSFAGVITQSIDDTIKTPYAHVFNVVVGRELAGDFSVEAAYVGRQGRNLLIRRDLAMPLNLMDRRSGMDYFTAAQQVIRATADITSAAPAAFSGIPSIPYWENLFPGAAGAGLTATQSIARAFFLNAPDYITALYDMDLFCDPACSIFGPFAFFNDQYDSLAGQSSIASAEYNALQFSLRKRWSHGYQFDFNYTLSKSEDLGSAVERGAAFTAFFNGGYTGFLVNPWNPDLQFGPSDFDVRHQINMNWVADLPFGRGRWMGGNASGVVNQLIGDWQVSGLLRLTSGFPFNVINCRSCWPTNWNLQGNAELADPNRLPETRSTRNAVGGQPSPFANPTEARGAFRRALPGEVGLRNRLRGDGYFTIDLGVIKSWTLPYAANHRLGFRWETFNVTNTPRFDSNQVTMFPDIGSTFGRYDGTLATCDSGAGRCMQFSLRYEW